MNHSDIDDPLLTAYALGELDPAERAKVEARLQIDAEARQFVEETRAFAEHLAGSLGTVPAPDLTPEQKAAVLAEAQVAPPSRGKVIRFPLWTVPLATIAAVLVAMSLISIKQPAEPPAGDASGVKITLAAMPTQTPSAILASTAAALPAKEASELTKAFVVKQLADLAKKPAEPSIADVDSPALPTFSVPTMQPLSAAQSQAGYAINQPVFEVKKGKNIAANGSDQKFEGRIDYGAPIDSISVKAVPPSGNAADAAKIATVPAAPQAGPARPIKQFAQGWSSDSGTITSDRLFRSRAAQAPTGEGNTEAYDRISDNEFLAVRSSPLSTFSIDVDTASFTNARRFLEGGNLPPKDAVRIEELLNYFPYDYAPPQGEDPFSVNVEVAPAPWNGKHLLAKIGLKGRVIAPEKRPATNLVFLLDVSGSMDEPNKLPLVRKSMKMLVERLNPEDRVAIIIYAGASGMALPSTPASKRREITQAIDTLRAGGSTNGAAGIELAYDVAKANFIEGGANRVVLCTDGDFNVGVTNQGDLLRLIEAKAKSKVFLTVLGFGMGNYKDSTLEKLADRGNGNYGYIDDEREAKKMLVDGLSSTLVTIAKDVKAQVEFNPTQVGSYRLIGYENRLLKAEDFNNDAKDAGEIGAGHTVTALYELAPVGEEQHLPGVDALKYQQANEIRTRNPVPANNELLTVKLRYKQPEGDVSKLIEQVVTSTSDPWVDSKKDGARSISKDFQFAAAVAEFGMLLRDSPFKGDASWKSAADLAENGLGADPQGYRHEFLKLIEQARKLSEPASPANAR